MVVNNHNLHQFYQTDIPNRQSNAPESASNWKIFDRHPNAEAIAQGLDIIPQDWSLTPLREKRPYRENWQNEEPVSRDEIRKGILDGNQLISKCTGKPYTAFDSGFGLRLGDVSGGLIAIDVDGETAEPLLQAISNGDIPTTVSWTSGKPGRYQLLFQIPVKWRDRVSTFTRAVLTEFNGIKTQHNDEGKPEELLEFRYNTVQSVLPPSYHPSTGSYKWINSPEDIEVAPVPDWLLNWLISFAEQEEEEKAEQERKEREREQRRAERKRQRQINGFVGADSIEDALEKAVDSLDHEDIFHWGGHAFKKHGRKLVGYCPRHESTSGTAFQINPETNEWYCHGCQEGGHAVQYRHFLTGGNGTPKGQNFIAIAHQLCEEAGVEFPAFSQQDYQAYIQQLENERLEAEVGAKLISREEWLVQQSQQFWDWFYNNVAKKPLTGFDPKVKEQQFKRGVDNLTKIRYGKDPLPTPEDAADLGEFQFEIKKPGDRLNLAKELIQLGWKHGLDVSHPGSGKSHHWNQFISSDGKTYYIIVQHRNPTVSTAETKADVPSRHQGLTLDHSRQTPNGNPYRHRWEYSPETPTPDIEGNCHQADRFNKLHTKGYDIWGTNVKSEDSGETDNAICAGCSKRSTCLIAGYKFERNEAFKHNELRIHPDSHAHVDPEDINIWEEASESFRGTQKITLTKFDIEETFNWFEKAALESSSDGEIAQAYRRLSQIKHKVIDALTGKIKVDHHGATTLPDAEGNANLAQVLGIESYPKLAKDLAIFSDVIAENATLEDKNLSDFKDNQVDRNNGFTQQERKRWRETIKFANSKLYGETAQHNDEIINNLPTLGLDKVLYAIFGLERGSVRLRNGEITFTLPYYRHAELASNAKFNAYLDATIDPHWLAAKLGVNRSQIAVIAQEEPDYSNLTVQAIHNEGMNSRQYSDDCKRRVKALVNAIKENCTEDVATLAWKDTDWLDEQINGYWFNHNRATNELKGVPNLIAIGTPYTNYGEIKDEYYALHGTVNGFDAFYDRLRQDEIIQLIGRQRPHLYPDREFHVYLIGSNLNLAFLEEMGIEVTYQEGLEITPEAGKSRQQTIIKLIQQAIEVGEAFFQQTQTAIAKQLGVSQKNVSEILGRLTRRDKNGKKLKWQDRLKFLYRSLYRQFIGIGINPDFGVGYQALMQQALDINFIRNWLALPIAEAAPMLEATVSSYIYELVRLLEHGEDITQLKEINGLHPIFVVSLALGISPPE